MNLERDSFCYLVLLLGRSGYVARILLLSVPSLGVPRVLLTLLRTLRSLISNLFG